MDRKTADLEYYVKRAGWSDGDSVFDQADTKYRPQLRSDRQNRVLLYPGSFNPPHIGHLALVKHVFENCRDINVIAAFIVPLDDHRVERKCSKLGQSLVLTKNQRVQLWRGYTTSPWYTVYGRREWEWDLFRKSLEKATAQDGYWLKFVVLYGPDLISLHEGSHWDSGWDCDEIVTSNVARPASFTAHEGKLLRLKGCHRWERLSWDEAKIAQHAETMVAFNKRNSMFKPSRAQLEKLRSESVEMLRSMRVCRRKGFPSNVIRFIPTTVKLDSISSTLIRRTIDDCAPGQLQTKLASMVLYPRLLVRLLQRKQQAKRRWAQEACKKKRKEKEERKRGNKILIGSSLCKYRV